MLRKNSGRINSKTVFGLFGHRRYFCSIPNSLLVDDKTKNFVDFIENAHNKSHQFVLKKFDEIQIGDIISSYQDFNLYLIYQKNIKEVLCQEKNSSNKLYLYPSTREFLVGENIRESLMFRTNYIFGAGGTLELVERKETEFSDSLITFGLNFLVVDQNHPKKLFHRNEINIGDVFLNKHDKNYYKVVEFIDEMSMDYGGTTYNASYFNTIQLDQQFNQTSNKGITIPVGDFRMELQNHFVVLDKEYFKSFLPDFSFSFKYYSHV